VVESLLEHGAAVDCADSDQRTALRAAAWGGHEDIVLALLRHGADVNQTDDEGRTALIAAAYMGHSEIVEHLLDFGAEINHEDADGRTALSVAALCVPANEGYAKVCYFSFILAQSQQIYIMKVVPCFQGFCI
jgi:ankyrin repeat protein